MIELLCPKCGAVLNQYVITSYPPINMTSCPSCGWEHETREPIIQAVYSKPKPQTNADKIRSMTDEELADFIGTHDCLDCPLNNEDDWCAGSAGSCRGNVLDWLKSPMEESNGT